MKYESKLYYFHSRNCVFKNVACKNGGHFVSVSMGCARPRNRNAIVTWMPHLVKYVGFDTLYEFAINMLVRSVSYQPGLQQRRRFLITRSDITPHCIQHTDTLAAYTVFEFAEGIPYLALTVQVGSGWSIVLLKNWHNHDDVIQWKHFPRYWPFVQGVHRSPVNSSHKGQWRGTLMLSLICAWINGCVNNGSQ